MFSSASYVSRKRLSLTNDIIFKALFARQRHLLADLINAVRSDQPAISIVDVLNPNIQPEDISSKQIVLDILARDANGMIFIVEMQLRHYQHWPERNVYYLASGLANQLEIGQDYRHLKPAIGISLLASDLFVDHPDKACWHFTLCDTHRPRVRLGDALQVHIIELRKAERLLDLSPELSDWIACLQHTTDEDAMSRITHPPVKEALQHLEAMYTDQELRLMAERRERAIIDDIDARDYSRREGQVQLLQQQITRKFGPLPADIPQRLWSASDEDLNAWGLNLLDAATLDGVFERR